MLAEAWRGLGEMVWREEEGFGRVVGTRKRESRGRSCGVVRDLKWGDDRVELPV